MVGGVLATLAARLPPEGDLARRGRRRRPSISATVLGAVWIGGGLGVPDPAPRDCPSHGRLALFTVLLAVWAGDTLAYLGGRLLGRHKMAPTTSPGKTWEGFVFGTAATIFVAFVALYKQHFLTIGQSIVLGVVLAVAAPLGDLFESLLKRDAGVKDSGTPARRPRRHARPPRRAPLRRPGRVLRDPRLLSYVTSRDGGSHCPIAA